MIKKISAAVAIATVLGTAYPARALEEYESGREAGWRSFYYGAEDHMILQARGHYIDFADSCINIVGAQCEGDLISATRRFLPASDYGIHSVAECKEKALELWNMTFAFSMQECEDIWYNRQ